MQRDTFLFPTQDAYKHLGIIQTKYVELLLIDCWITLQIRRYKSQDQWRRINGVHNWCCYRARHICYRPPNTYLVRYARKIRWHYYRSGIGANYIYPWPSEEKSLVTRSLWLSWNGHCVARRGSHTYWDGHTCFYFAGSNLITRPHTFPNSDHFGDISPRLIWRIVNNNCWYNWNVRVSRWNRKNFKPSYVPHGFKRKSAIGLRLGPNQTKWNLYGTGLLNSRSRYSLRYLSTSR